MAFSSSWDAPAGYYACRLCCLDCSFPRSHTCCVLLVSRPQFRHQSSRPAFPDASEEDCTLHCLCLFLLDFFSSEHSWLSETVTVCLAFYCSSSLQCSLCDSKAAVFPSLPCHGGPRGSQQALTESSSSHLTKHKVTNVAEHLKFQNTFPPGNSPWELHHPDMRLTYLVACLVPCRGCWPPPSRPKWPLVESSAHSTLLGRLPQPFHPRGMHTVSSGCSITSSRFYFPHSPHHSLKLPF